MKNRWLPCAGTFTAYRLRAECGRTETFDLQPAQKQLKLKEQCQIYCSTEKHWYYVFHYSVTSLDFCHFGTRFIISRVLNAKGYVLLIFLFFSGAMTSCFARTMGKEDTNHKCQHHVIFLGPELLISQPFYVFCQNAAWKSRPRDIYERKCTSVFQAPEIYSCHLTVAWRYNLNFLQLSLQGDIYGRYNCNYLPVTKSRSACSRWFRQQKDTGKKY